MNIQNEAIDVCRLFNIKGELEDFSVFTDGHINTTYMLAFSEDDEVKKYLVQGINTHVFKNPPTLMENIVNVTEFLRKKYRFILGYLIRQQCLKPTKWNSFLNALTMS